MSIEAAAELLRESANTVALTGAGFSTASGIPDFRSEGSGLWKIHDPMEVASLSAFRTQPQRFFEWIHPLTVQIFAAQPNPAHQALAQLESLGILQLIITQNIDGLHQRAGSRNVIEVHGALERLTCVTCLSVYPAGDFLPTYLEQHSMPRCPECGGILKPNVILFEEQLPFEAWQRAQDAARNCEVMIIAGSSLEVMPVASLPMQALDAGAKLILINQNAIYLDPRADVILNMDVAEALPQITSVLQLKSYVTMPTTSVM